jgi:hypothetical protein
MVACDCKPSHATPRGPTRLHAAPSDSVPYGAILLHQFNATQCGPVGHHASRSDVDPEQCVAVGAAIQAATLLGLTSGVELMDGSYVEELHQRASGFQV